MSKELDEKFTESLEKLMSESSGVSLMCIMNGMCCTLAACIGDITPDLRARAIASIFRILSARLCTVFKDESDE